jgi:hypothetical protein
MGKVLKAMARDIVRLEVVNPNIIRLYTVCRPLGDLKITQRTSIEAMDDRLPVVAAVAVPAMDV